MENNRKNLFFHSLNKKEWLQAITSARGTYNRSDKTVHIIFDKHIQPNDLQPIHLVTLACLIQFFADKGCQIFLSNNNEAVMDMLISRLRFHEYWQGGKNHVDSLDNNIFNLWRVTEPEKDLYAKNVEHYFKSRFFHDRDLSIISLNMVEAYYNVFDHADAEGNAFSLIKYDQEEDRLHVAICDFGIGIAQSVKNFNKEINNDKEALQKSIEIDFTVGSKSHNKGKGLDNILSSSDVVRIISNNAILIKLGDRIKILDLDFDFNGTLIYFEIRLDETEKEEILDEFEL